MARPNAYRYQEEEKLEAQDIHHNAIFNKLANLILEGAKKAYPDQEPEFSSIYDSIGDPPKREMGHFAFPCFPLARVCKEAPPKIAQKLKDHIEDPEFIRDIVVQGPYLNFVLKTLPLGNFVIESILKQEYFKGPFVTPLKLMVEYSQPNTHKELHVGHMRNACLGNALVRIFTYGGHDVKSTTYPGDSGTHVAKCLWYFRNHMEGEPPQEEKGAWLGHLYSLAHLKLEDELGTEKEEQNRAELTAILQQLEAEEGEYFDLWKETRQWSLDLMKDVYDWTDISFDRWYFESEEDTSSVEMAKKLFDEGKLVKDQGAIGMDLKADKLGFCILLKSDGNGNYATKDISLAIKKFNEFGLDRSIYIVDERQSYHFKQVFKVLEKLGHEFHKDCFHLAYNFVELPDGAMSSRKGNIVPLMELVHQMEKTIKNDYLHKYENEWSAEEIEKTATMIANGAIKYGMIRMDHSKKIVFDMAEWLKLDGETGPYLQYVHARIESLCKKLRFSEENKVDWSVIEKPSELNLMLKLSSFNSVITQCADQMKTAPLCAYLYELGKLFNSFYVDCPIGKAETEELKVARLAISKAVGLVMEKGLNLLGIPAPDRM